MKKKKDEITIRSSAAEYLTYVAFTGDGLVIKRGKKKFVKVR